MAVTDRVILNTEAKGKGVCHHAYFLKDSQK